MTLRSQPLAFKNSNSLLSWKKPFCLFISSGLVVDKTFKGRKYSFLNERRGSNLLGLIRLTSFTVILGKSIWMKWTETVYIWLLQYSFPYSYLDHCCEDPCLQISFDSDYACVCHSHLNKSWTNIYFKFCYFHSKPSHKF